jgi:hypothetical protein
MSAPSGIVGFGREPGLRKTVGSDVGGYVGVVVVGGSRGPLFFADDEQLAMATPALTAPRPFNTARLDMGSTPVCLARGRSFRKAAFRLAVLSILVGDAGEGPPMK